MTGSSRTEPGASVRENSVWLLAGNVAFSGCQWGILVVYAKLGSPEQVGEFAGALAVALPLFLLASLQLRGLVSTDARGEFDSREYVTLRVLASSLAFAALALGALVFASSPMSLMLFLAVGATRLVDSLQDVLYGLFQQRETMRDVGVSMAVRGALGLLFTGFVFWSTGSLPAAVASTGAGWALVLMLHDVPRARALAAGGGEPSNGNEPHGLRLSPLLRLAAPMGGVLALASLSENLPRYIIEHRIGVRELGFYAAAFSLAQIAQTVVSSVSSSGSPRLARLYAEKDYVGFKKLFGRMLAVGFAVGGAMVAVSIVVGTELLGFLFTEDYAPYGEVLVLLMLLALVRFQASLLGTAVTSTRRFRIQFVIHALSVSLVGSLALALVAPYGLIGVIAASFAGTLALTAGYGVVVYRTLTHPGPTGT